MEIFYRGSNITDMVEVSRCTVRDTSRNRCDSLEIEFENAAGWYRWGPKEDDTIIVTQSGYTTGIMYVNTIQPEDDKFIVFATSLPCAARRKENRSFIKKTLGEIIRTCAGYTGMGYGIYGVDKDIVIPYITQNYESAAAFLCRLMALEGAVMKCANGKYVVISNDYIMDSNPALSIALEAGQNGIEHHKIGTATRKITVKTPYAEASAIDSSVPETHPQIIANTLPAMDNAQAKRWARGKLLCLNRQCEQLDIESVFNPAMTAAVKADVYGANEGEWYVEESVHDLMNLRTASTLRRCVRTIH